MDKDQDLGYGIGNNHPRFTTLGASLIRIRKTFRLHVFNHVTNPSPILKEKVMGLSPPSLTSRKNTPPTFSERGEETRQFTSFN
jgi:hypothetical protein